MSKSVDTFTEDLLRRIGDGLTALLSTNITFSRGELDRLDKHSFERFGNDFVALLTATVTDPYAGTVYVAFDLPRVVVLGALLEMVPPAGIAERLTVPVFDEDNADAFEEVGNILVGKLDEAIRDRVGFSTIHTKKADTLHGPTSEMFAAIDAQGEYHCLDATINIAGQEAGPVAFLLFPALMHGDSTEEVDVVRSQVVKRSEEVVADAPTDRGEDVPARTEGTVADAAQTTDRDEPGVEPGVEPVATQADSEGTGDEATIVDILSTAVIEPALGGTAAQRSRPAAGTRLSGFVADTDGLVSGDKTVLLVVDDDITTRAMIRSYLEGPNISIFEAVSWREAGLFLRRHRVDGILLDLYLSDVNGIDACRKLHLHPATCDVPVVLCTSRPSREAVVKGLKAGAADFLIKPFNRARLIEKLDTVLQSA
jgi:CheY-like chemotaxis protein